MSKYIVHPNTGFVEFFRSPSDRLLDDASKKIEELDKEIDKYKDLNSRLTKLEEELKSLDKSGTESSGK